MNWTKQAFTRHVYRLYMFYKSSASEVSLRALPSPTSIFSIRHAAPQIEERRVQTRVL